MLISVLRSRWFARVSKYTLVLLFLSLVILFVLMRAYPYERSDDPLVIVVSLVGTFLPLTFQITASAVLPILASVCMYIGVGLGLLSYLSLNTSFGITPAVRDIKENGMYALVRHPIYASYLPVHIGYVLGNMSIINLGVLLATWCALLARIYFEEVLLLQNAQYRSYSERVKYRLIPYVY
jgi:protein-S-isoprenylcysteine O-methyltransferase Ste14